MTAFFTVLSLVAVAALYFYVGYRTGYEKGLEERDALWDSIHLRRNPDA